MTEQVGYQSYYGELYMLLINVNVATFIQYIGSKHCYYTVQNKSGKVSHTLNSLMLSSLYLPRYTSIIIITISDFTTDVGRQSSMCGTLPLLPARTLLAISCDISIN